MFFVYIDHKPDGEPFYVGKGSEKRVSYPKRNTWHSNIRDKYPDWSRKRVFSGTNAECIAMEVSLIAKYGRRDLGAGPLVNLTNGGEGKSGFVVSDETREKIRASNKGKKYGPKSDEVKEKIRAGNIGKNTKKPTPEVIAKRRSAITGRNLSESHKLKIGDRHRGKTVSEETRLKLRNRCITEETRLKMSNAQKGKIMSAETRAKLSAALLGKSKMMRIQEGAQCGG